MFHLHRNAAAPACGRDCATCARLRAAVPAAVRDRGLPAVDLEALAEAAGMSERAVREHLGGDVLGALGSAYLVSATGLQQGFHRAYALAPTPREGVQRSIAWLLGTLAADPDRALFSYVEITQGGRPLVALRERIRRSSAGFWELQYATNHPRALLPRSHFQMVNDATIALIVEHVRRGTTDRLPEHVETVMTLLEAIPPPPPAAAAGA